MATEVWRVLQIDHPDRAYCFLLLEGIREGFRINFCHGESMWRSADANMWSALDHAEVISRFLAGEVASGRGGGFWQGSGALLPHVRQVPEPSWTCAKKTYCRDDATYCRLILPKGG